MALSIALIMFFGMMGNLIFTKIKLPGLLGMIVVGVIIGPHSLNLLDQSILNVSGELRKIALIIILLRAGLGLNRNELKKVGKTALKMSFIPGLFEGLTIAFVSIWLLKIDFIRGGMLGFILAAVSPAVVVPLMLKFIDERRGMKKGIPILILSASSIDDVFAITIFTSFMGIYANKNFNIGIELLNIPISIIIGVILGIVLGLILVTIFIKYRIRDSKKVILILSIAIFLVSLEKALENGVMIASLLGVMAMGFVITERIPALGVRLSAKFNKMWVLAELFLFVLVGAEVNMKVALDAGLIGLVVITFGLVARSMGVLVSTIGSHLNLKEKIFSIVSYLPKATVQAAIGGIPLSLGVIGGDLILAIAVLSIIVTAPLGAIGINFLAPKLLEQDLIENV
ncbi:MAG: Na(+)/H(+) antiporter [Haloplasmataceae bacterium]|jgi:NhaP-type Na+/H+ or K+/H+ antiporter|nr:Na(+)/H(+) antiporter [Haloplasmataceae bacterium]